MKWPTNEELKAMTAALMGVDFGPELPVFAEVPNLDYRPLGKRYEQRDTIAGPKTNFDEAYAEVHSRSTLIPWKKARTI